MHIEHKTVARNINDPFLGVKYDMIEVNATHLREYFTSKYESFIADAKSSDISTYDKDAITNNDEIYHYQNFFLCKRGDELHILDGFRRLLVFNPPNVDILVRVYDNLSEVNILKMLIALNHHKLLKGSGISFQMRGFSLALRSIFGVDISKFRYGFAGYIGQAKSSYGSSYTSENTDVDPELLKQRIVHDNFINDLKIMEKIVLSNIPVISKLGTYIFETSGVLNSSNMDMFIQKLNDNPTFVKLRASLKKTGDNTSTNSNKVKIQMLELYKSVIDEFNGVEREMSFAEIVDQVNKLKSEFKKDKSNSGYTLLSHPTNCEWKTINKLIKCVNDGVNVSFKIFITPKMTNYDDVKVAHGFFDDSDISFVPAKGQLNRAGTTYSIPPFDIIINSLNAKVSGTYYSDYTSSPTLTELTDIESKRMVSCKVDVFYKINN